MVYRASSYSYPTRILFGFTAGFVATLTFHQLTLWVLWLVSVAPFAPYLTAVARPHGVPPLISLAVWGGLWGILFALIEGRFPARTSYWVVAFLFGAVFPTLIALLVVLPLKGRAMGGGWHPSLIVTAFIINGAWGIGTGLFLRILSGWFSRWRSVPA